MLKIEIRTTGREIFLFSSPSFSIFRAMKYATLTFWQIFLRKYTIWCVAFIFLFVNASCGIKNKVTASENNRETTHYSIVETPSEIDTFISPKLKPVLPAAYSLRKYLPLLRREHIGLVANQSSMLGPSHLVDTLLSNGIKIDRIFSPEHGFRGKAGAGEIVDNSCDAKTGIEIVSLYGNNRRPTIEQLAGIDVMLFDLQDVGVRFYTYISTLTYIMEACAQNNIPVVVLDRPNPNGSYVDGPVLEPKYRSFIGLHPVPIVYGMTIGEYAQMVNGEKWITTPCDLTVIPCSGYTHDRFYHLSVQPSPNLRSDAAIAWYPSLCLFEGTVASVGRGTPAPFQMVGHPAFPFHDYFFVPQADEGASNPIFNGDTCYGFNFQKIAAPDQIELQPLLDFYCNYPDTLPFFRKDGFFDLLSGTDSLRQQIIRGESEETIRNSWKTGLEQFKTIREKYLIYP